jgi:DNA-binding beta-propeller fold protein YncE
MRTRSRRCAIETCALAGFVVEAFGRGGAVAAMNDVWRRWASAVGAVIVSCGMSAPAEASVRRDDTARPTLAQLTGAGSCVAQNPELRDCQQTKALIGASDVAVSPDGANVYVASRGDRAGQNGGLAAFARDALTGRLSAIGCVTTSGTNGEDTTNGQCIDGDGLAGLNSVVVSPDGRNVYATASVSNAVDVFRRDPATGQLTQLGCVQHYAPRGSRCVGELPLAGPTDIVVSPDGSSVYVSTSTVFFSGVVTYARDPDTGALTARACVSNDGNDGICATGAALDGLNALAISADGANLYAVGGRDAAQVVRLARDPATGAAAASDCMTSEAIAGSVCSSVAAAPGASLIADGASSVAASPSGDTIYVGLPVGAIAWSGPRLSVDGCITIPESVAAGFCATSPGLYQISRVVVSPDGKTVYATDGRNDSLVSLRRSPDGQLWAGSCIAVDQVGCSAAKGLASPLGIAVSPDGTSVYVAAQDSSAVTVYGPSLSIESTRARLLGRQFALTLSCPANVSRACAGELRVAAPRVPRRPRHHVRARLASVRRYSVKPGKTIRLGLTLRKPVRRALAKQRKLVLVATAVQRHGDRRATTRLITVTR